MIGVITSPSQKVVVPLKVGTTGGAFTVTTTSVASLSQPNALVVVTKTDCGLVAPVVPGSKEPAGPANKLAGPGLGLAS